MSSDGKGGRPVRRPRVIDRPRVQPGPLADLKALIYELYLRAGAPTLDDIATEVAEDDGLDGAPGRDTISRIIGDPGLPASQLDVVAVVTVLARTARWNSDDAARRTRDMWVAAWMASARHPATGVRVSEASPRRLGVHAAICVPGVPEEVPPEYVPRDADGGEFGVRARVAAAAERGGFVLLVGGSSVGKTRCAFEAVAALLPEWWLVHPAGPGDVAALAATPTVRTVVWLDELQRYLDGERGLTGGVVRALLGVPDPVVIIGTLWPDRYATYAALPPLGGADPHARAREVLELAAVVRIDAVFSPAEQDQARAASVRDRRLRVALEAAGYGLTQTLAAAPQLVARWEDARTASPYAWAVITAALDAARLGARAPLSADLLRAAAPGYCTSQQQAEAPDNWFEQALAYATSKLYGAVAVLSPAGAGMGQVAGYTAADYLIQHASQQRRYARVPASTWDAILSHVRDPADITRLVDSARNRLLYCYLIPLYRHAADAGDWRAAGQLAELLAERGDLDELRARADAGGEAAADQLAGLLAERGDLDELRARADAGDKGAARRLAGLLAERGDLDEAEQVLRTWADAGERDAAMGLAGLMEGRGDLDEAEQVLRTWADVGDKDAAWRLADLLGDRGDLDELRARADAGDKDAARRLADLLGDRGDLDELRARADAGDELAAWRLAGLVVHRADLDELRALADTGDRYAAKWLASLLAERGDLDELRARADAGDSHAAYLLSDHGDLDELRARADAGDKFAALQLNGLLGNRGDLDELRARADAGDSHAAYLRADLLVGRGDLDEAQQILRPRADTGDLHAVHRLNDLLAGRGDLDELRARADAGDNDAAHRLTELLAERGDLDELRARADAGEWHAVRRLTDLLADRGDLDGLRARVVLGDDDPARRRAGLLAALLIKQGRVEEAEHLRRFGLNPDGSTACA